jgi:hypothetical protein
MAGDEEKDLRGEDKLLPTATIGDQTLILL